MKKILFLLMVMVSFSAQGQKRKQAYMPEEGYWVVESNTSSLKKSTVYFYTSDDILIYKENVEGKKINIRKKKTVFQLNQVLRQSIIAWNREQVVRENNMLVKNRL
jgi:hypothetical protein